MVPLELNLELFHVQPARSQPMYQKDQHKVIRFFSLNLMTRTWRDILLKENRSFSCKISFIHD
jgi:hypothetical protein